MPKKYDTLMGLLGKGISEGAASGRSNLEQKAALERLLQGQQQSHDLAEQGAMSRTSKAEELIKKYPGMGITVSKEGASMSPRTQHQLEVSLTPGQKAADVAFGKDYADYQAGGGRAGVEKNLGLLEKAAKGMEERGMIEQAAGILPRSLRDYIVPSDTAREDAVRSAIQDTMKQALGSQFTEREGIARMERAFNPRLSGKENMERVMSQLQELRELAAAKERSARQFEATGTLKGMKASQPVQPQAPSGTDARIKRLQELRKKYGR